MSMSNAQRQRLYIARLKEKAGLAMQDDAQELEALAQKAGVTIEQFIKVAVLYNEHQRKKLDCLDTKS